MELCTYELTPVTNTNRNGILLNVANILWYSGLSSSNNVGLFKLSVRGTSYSSINNTMLSVDNGLSPSTSSGWLDNHELSDSLSVMS